jgi:16S rRNA (uracil1498-N3)-methyltransferase
VLERIQADQPPVRLTLLASLIKFDRFEWIVEKATELGAEKIVPVLAGRSEKGLERAAAKRSDRWRKVALESSQQSRRSRLPEIEDCVTLEEALGAIGQFRFLLDEEREAPPLMAALESAGPAVSSDVVCLLVGPEGGWTSQEREAAVGAGWAQVSLGPTILRTETAAVAALAIVANFWQATEKRKPPAAGAIGGPQTRSQ